MQATSCCHRCFKDLGSVQSEAVDRTFATGIHLPSQVLQEIVRAGKGPLHHAFISGFPVPWGLEKPRAGLTVKPPQTRCVHCLKHYLARKQALLGSSHEMPCALSSPHFHCARLISTRQSVKKRHGNQGEPKDIYTAPGFANRQQ